MNSHAVFGICSTVDELEYGIRRIVPIVQREGLAYRGKNMCIIKIDEEKMMINEVDKDEYLKNITDD